MHPLLFLHQLEWIAGTSLNTNAAAGAEIFINNRQVFFIHADGAKGAGYGACRTLNTHRCTS